MDFGLSDDQSLFAASLRRWLGERVPIERVRTVMATRSGFDAALLAELADQGATGVLVPEEHGGAGLGLLDAALVAEEIGAAVAPLSFHSACVMAPLALTLAGTSQQKSRWLPEIAAGRALLSFVAEAPEADGGVLDGNALHVPDAEAAAAFIVSTGDELLLVPRDAPGLRFEKLMTVDDTRRVGEVVFERVRIESDMRLAADVATVARIIDAGRVALAADALGAAERSLERSVAYAEQRKQFDRVIGSFQAVKHMCAETVADIEPLRSLLWYAAFAWDEQREDAALAATLLKAHAGEVAVRATTTTLQVFGGMGFTWECDAHLWFKRAGYDRQTLGGPAALRARAAELAAL